MSLTVTMSGTFLSAVLCPQVLISFVVLGGRTLGATEDDPRGPSSTVHGPTVEATDPDAFCSMPDIAKSVDWSHEEPPFKVGHSLILKCRNESETLLGPPTIKCIDPGAWDWDEGKIKCKYVLCSEPAIPANGNVTLSSQTILPGTTAVYSCDSGYVLEGSGQLRCMASGQWTGTAPTCQEECQRTEIADGQLVARCLYRECTAWIKCNKGFFVVGKNKLVCGRGGEWQASNKPKCEPIMCTAPPRISDGTFRTEPLPTTDHRYVYHTVVMYTCLDDSLVLHGAVNLTCMENGEWSGDPPVCVNGTVSNVSVTLGLPTGAYNNGTEDRGTPPGGTSRCPDLEHVPYASYAVRNHSRLVTYTCHHGYELHGSAQRECLANGSWSGESPTCIPVRMEHVAWKNIFRDNKEWKGSYLYNEVQVGFRFWYLKSTGTSIQTLLLDDLNAKLDLKGVHLGDVIVFETTRLLVPSEILHDTGWQVRGELTNDTQGWKYSGTVRSSDSGYSTLYMRPVQLVDYEAPPLSAAQEYASATALALGVAIAIMAIIVAAILAAYCMKRKGGFKGTGHRTLTSFENPVYEYENNVAVKVI